VKKNIIKVSFMVTTCALSVCAMEHASLFEESSSINSYESITDTILYDIRQQELALLEPVRKSAPTHYDVMSSSLQDMHKKFSEMSDDYKRAVIKAISTRLLLLFCTAICLPKDVVKDHICLYMMDGVIAPDLTQKEINEQKEKIGNATKEFYTMPIAQAFEWYHIIKVNQTDDTKPIGLSYLLSQSEQDLVSQLSPSWYCSIPIVSQETKKMFDGVRGDLKQFLQGKEIVVVSNDNNNMCAPKTACKNCMCSVGFASCVFGSFSGLFALSGLCCSGTGAGAACEFYPLIISGAFAGGVLLCGPCAVTHGQECLQCSKRITL
jgi:hypothetical protein